jgi:hypothetical protein
MSARCIKCCRSIRRRAARPGMRVIEHGLAQLRARLAVPAERTDDPMIDYETYCKIRDHRDRQGLSITQTAQALGLHPGDGLEVVAPRAL